jgi:intein-encoded DNA endonuclease-like protein
LQNLKGVNFTLSSYRCLLNYQAMETPVKHYKFVNSKPSNIIYYLSVDTNLDAQQLKSN